MGDAINRHLRFFHDLKESGLGLRRGTVDLIGKDDGGEDRTGTEVPLVVLLVVDIHARNVRGEHVGGELNTRVRARNCCCDRASKSGLSRTGSIFQKKVSPGEHSRQSQANNRFFVQQRLGDTADQTCEGFGETLGILRAKRHGRDSIHLSVSSDWLVEGWGLVPRMSWKRKAARLPRN